MFRCIYADQILIEIMYSFVIFAVLIGSISGAYDIAIYGATPGGISAAITAAQAAPSFSIVLIEPTAYIGGMAAAGGIGLRDLGLESTSKFIISIFPCFSVCSFD